MGIFDRMFRRKKEVSPKMESVVPFDVPHLTLVVFGDFREGLRGEDLQNVEASLKSCSEIEKEYMRYYKNRFPQESHEDLLTYEFRMYGCVSRQLRKVLVCNVPKRVTSELCELANRYGIGEGDIELYEPWKPMFPEPHLGLAFNYILIIEAGARIQQKDIEQLPIILCEAVKTGRLRSLSSPGCRLSHGTW